MMGKSRLMMISALVAAGVRVVLDDPLAPHGQPKKAALLEPPVYRRRRPLPLASLLAPRPERQRDPDVVSSAEAKRQRKNAKRLRELK